MIEYKVDNKHYLLSYNDLREKYLEFVEITDEEFDKRIIEATHLACIISWFKELPNDATLGDMGIIHELVHYMQLQEPSIRTIRKQYEELLKLT